MKIIKENYTVLSRYHLLDEKLSLKDKGLLTCLLSGTCCDGEILDINKLFSIINDNDSFKSTLESFFNLIDAGYIEEIDGVYVVMEKPRNLDGSKKVYPSRIDEESLLNKLDRYTPEYKKRNIKRTPY